MTTGRAAPPCTVGGTSAITSRCTQIMSLCAPASGQDRGLAAVGQDDRRRGSKARSGAAVHHQPPAPYHLGQVPGACLLAPGRQTTARAGAAAARAVARSKRRPAGRSLLVGVVRIRSWIATIQCFGCPASQPSRRDARVSPGGASGPVRCLPCRHLHVCKVSTRLPRAGSPRAAGRWSVVAEGGMPHPRPTAARRAAAGLGRHEVSCRTGRDDVVNGPGAPQLRGWGDGPDTARRCDADPGSPGRS